MPYVGGDVVSGPGDGGFELCGTCLRTHYMSRSPLPESSLLDARQDPIGAYGYADATFTALDVGALFTPIHLLKRGVGWLLLSKR